MKEKIKIICVVGPTASGKTGLGVDLALALGGEVISADSMQIYRGMPIASAVPSQSETKGVLHHLIEFLEPDESFTVADYVTVAREKIFNISSCGKIPIIVGGTGLYISALTEHISFTDQQPDIALRAKYQKLMDEIGAPAMLERLSKFDPETAARLHPNNTRRIIRAFEIYESTGITITEQNLRSKSQESPYNPVMIGINYRNRELLYDRINRRVDQMAVNGLFDEARASFEHTLKGGAAQAIGHKELFPYFKGEKSKQECLESLKQATRRYAKRQITWFGKDERIYWIYPDETPDVLQTALNYIKEEKM